MANCNQSQKEKVVDQGSHCKLEEFTLSLTSLNSFYTIVKILNKEIGFGKWTTLGRPVKKIRRVDTYNLLKATIPAEMGMDITVDRSTDVVFCLPADSSSIVSRLLLEISR